MHISQLDALLADAHIDILLPTTNNRDPDAILTAPPRQKAFYDEVLHAYLLLRPLQTPATPKLTPDMLKDIATSKLDIHMVASVGVVAEPASTPTAAVTTSSAAPTPPPAAHYMGSTAPHRNRSATTGPPVPRMGSPGPGASTPAAYLLSPTLSRRTTSLKANTSVSSIDLALKDGSAKDKSKKSPVSTTPLKDTKDEEIVFSYTYDPSDPTLEPIVVPDRTSCLFPVKVPIVTRKPKSKETKYQLTLIISITPKTTKPEPAMEEAAFCDHDEFDAPNLLADLAHDPYLNRERLPAHRPSQQTRRPSLSQALPVPRIIRKSIATQPILDVRVNIVDTGLDNILMSVELENNVSDNDRLSVEALSVEMTNAIISKADTQSHLNEVLNPKDELHLLYNITLLDEAPNDYPESVPGSLAASRATSMRSMGSVDLLPRIKRVLSISINGKTGLPGARDQIIPSRWFTQVLFGTDRESRTMLGLVPLYGTKNNLPKDVKIAYRNEESGVQMTFSVVSEVRLRKIFTVRVFLVNRSDKTRHLTIVVPAPSHTADNTTDTLSTPAGHEALNLHMSEDEFLRRYLAVEKREASLVCLENNVQLSPLHPNTCETVNLHFIPIKGMMHTIQHLQLIDRDTGRSTDIKDILEIHIDSGNT